jgi:hypothetical protein
MKQRCSRRGRGHNENVRRLGAWIVAVPVMVAGTEIAHTLAYRIVYPEAVVRWRVLSASGHGYMARAPLVLGLGFALVAVALVTLLVDAARRRPTTEVAPWAFALLPLLSFTAQEFLERWVALGSVPWWMVEQPTFRVGLLLQLPFAALAYLVARLLLRTARSAGAAVAVSSRVTVLLPTASALRPVAAATVRRRVPALGFGVRGPPILA